MKKLVSGVISCLNLVCILVYEKKKRLVESFNSWTRGRKKTHTWRRRQDEKGIGKPAEGYPHPTTCAFRKVKSANRARRCYTYRKIVEGINDNPGYSSGAMVDESFINVFGQKEVQYPIVTLGNIVKHYFVLLLILSWGSNDTIPMEQ